jgi:hypothetical protein
VSRGKSPGCVTASCDGFVVTAICRGGTNGLEMLRSKWGKKTEKDLRWKWGKSSILRFAFQTPTKVKL